MPQPDTHNLNLEAETDESLSLIQFLLKHIDLNGDITRIRIELESESAFDISEVVTDDLVTDTEPEPERDEPDDLEPVDDGLKEPPKSEDPEPEFVNDDLVRFDEDSDAFAVAKMLYERRNEGFLELGEVQQFTPNEAGVADMRFSKVLWDLANRGMVEKKDHPDDGRMNIYKLTSRGIRSVEAAVES